MKILAPSSEQESKDALDFAINSNLPCALLLGNQLPEHNLYNSPKENMLKWHMVSKAKRKEIALISNSNMLVHCIDAAKKDKHYEYTDVFNARSIKPLVV